MATSKIRNWVEESTSTVGTGSLTLTGRTVGHATFSEQCTTGELVNVTVKDGANKETGLFTLTAPNTLARTIIYEHLVADVLTKSPDTPMDLTGEARVIICQSEQYIDKRFGADWLIVTSATTLVDGSNVLVDSSLGPITITLPVSPVVGEKVSIGDYAGTFTNSNVTIARNSSLIEALAEDLILDINKPDLVLVYIDNVRGWVRVPR